MHGDVSEISALVTFVRRHTQQSLSSEQIAELRRLDASAFAVIQRHGESVYALATGGPSYNHFGGTKIPCYAMNAGVPLHPTDDWYRMMADIAARISKNGEASPAGGPPERNPPREDPILTQRQLNVLEALNDLKAFSSDKLRQTEDIVKRAEGVEADPASFKEPISDLAKAGFIRTKAGRGGGCWLLPKGRERVEQLRKR